MCEARIWFFKIAIINIDALPHSGRLVSGSQMKWQKEKNYAEYMKQWKTSAFFRYDQTANLMVGHFLAGAVLKKKNFASNAQKKQE